VPHLRLAALATAVLLAVIGVILALQAERPRLRPLDALLLAASGGLALLALTA
jgi:hypothetical protein